MNTFRRPADDLLDVVRALLLVQGCILVATTIESLFWGVVFSGAGGSVLLSFVAASVILVARARLRADRRRPRRLVYAVEVLTVALFVVDAALAVALTRGLPPLMAILTQLVLPLSVIALLRRSARAPRAPFASQHLSALEAA